MTAPNCSGLAGLTVITTADSDPMRDEGESYAKKVKEARKEVILKMFCRCAAFVDAYIWMRRWIKLSRIFRILTVKYITSVR